MPVEITPLVLPVGRFRKTPKVEPGKRYLAIGDIHGRADLLVELMRGYHMNLTGQDFTPADTDIIVLGDFIDRGPNSADVLKSLFHLRNRPGLTVLLGNHEAYMLDCALGLADPRDGWLDFGGDATLASLGLSPPRPFESDESFAGRLRDCLGEDVIEWFQAMPVSLRSGDFLFCHAGIRPGLPLDMQSRNDMLWIRDEFVDSSKDHGAVIVHGHTITDDICLRRNRIGVDTGAYRTGILTALVLQDSRAWKLVTRLA